VIVKVWAVPAHPTLLFVNVGVTVIVAITGELPTLVAVNEAIFPEPLAPSPIEGVLLVQE